LGRFEDEPLLDEPPELLGAEPPLDEPPPEGFDTLPPEPDEPREPELGRLWLSPELGAGLRIRRVSP
jgi:hypothetical protein